MSSKKWLSSLNLFGGLKPFNAGSAARDGLAGVNLASINLPQVLGYAQIAGAPLVTGFYTLLLPLVAFAIFGASRHLVVAADSATAAILAGSLARDAAPGSDHYMALLGMVALLTGGYLLLARIFKLGFLADFLSRTVLTGFLTGVGIQVGIAMLGDMFGVAVTSHYSLVRLWEVLLSLPHPHGPTLMLSTLVAGGILLGNRFAPRLPLSLIAVVGTIAASSAFHFAGRGIAIIGPVAGGFPSLRFPPVTWREMLMLMPVAGSCFVMIIAQSAATSRAFAMRYHEGVDTDADILGLSAANIAAALTGTFVVNGSPTQTATADRAGSRSQFAQLTLAAVVVLVLLFLLEPLQFLPRCVLAAVVFSIGVGMIKARELRDIRRESPGEYYLAIATAAAVVVLGVEQGVLLAIAVSLLRHVRHSYHPHSMMLMAADATGRWAPVPATPGKETEPGLIVYRFAADLFYANQNRFSDELRALVKFAPTPVHWVIIDASAITDIDCSAAQSVRDLLAEMAGKHVVVVFARVTSYLRSDLDRHRITPVVGAERIFATMHEAIAYVHAPT
ncbi:MAG TPA: SulP family inorganic anion transporter [Steroidobacteraceae bacterium]